MRCESPASSGPENLSEWPVKYRLLGVLLVVLSGLAIAVVPTAAKLAFEAGANTLTVVTLRGVVGMALMALFMAAFGQSFRLPGRTLVPCAAAGIAHALVAYGFIGSVAHILVSLVVLIYATQPILLALIFHLQGHERLTPRKLALAFMVLVGLAFVLEVACLGFVDRDRVPAPCRGAWHGGAKLILRWET